MILEIGHEHWDGPVADPVARQALAALEQGAVLHLPRLPFGIGGAEDRLFSVGLAGGAKNVSFAPAAGRLAHAAVSGADRSLLTTIMTRFSASASELVASLLARYAADIQIARASFRPAEIAGRATSWRKDDTRLHVDSFPASPTGGRRILRVFSNVNPRGRPRTWRVGSPFADVANRYGHALRLPWPGEAAVLRALRVTKARRTAYDALMLQLHDLMKRDADYQSAATHQTIAFGAGSTWLCFTDEVSHAAMAGQFQLEQTFLLPVSAMAAPERSPLRILEGVFGRNLA